MLVPFIPLPLLSSPGFLDLLNEVSLLNSAMALDTTAVQIFDSGGNWTKQNEGRERLLEKSEKLALRKELS